MNKYGGLESDSQKKNTNDSGAVRTNGSNLNDTMDALNKCFKHTGDMDRAFGRNGSAIIKRAYRTMAIHIRELQRDKEVVPSKEEIDNIANSCNIMVDVMMYSEQLSITKDVTRYYSSLVINWNDNTIRNNSIRRLSTVALRLLNAKTTLDDSIFVVQRLLTKLRGELRYEAPASKLSRHYLNSLDGVLEE